jgi:hypothetical protein
MGKIERKINAILVFGIYQGFTAFPEGYPYKILDFWQGPSSFNSQSRFPDHSAESTGRVCINTAVLCL